MNVNAIHDAIREFAKDPTLDTATCAHLDHFSLWANVSLANRSLPTMHSRHRTLNRATQQRENRQTYLNRIATLGERVKGRKGLWIAMVNGGMDCDCSKWDNAVSLVRATVKACDAWVEAFYSGAEGPQWFCVERPSVAAELERSSRDLALEAFEDGHPHVVYY